MPPSSGHSEANTPHEQSNPGVAQSCNIQMSVSAIFFPPRFSQSAALVLSAPLAIGPDLSADYELIDEHYANARLR